MPLNNSSSNSLPDASNRGKNSSLPASASYWKRPATPLKVVQTHQVLCQPGFLTEAMNVLLAEDLTLGTAAPEDDEKIEIHMTPLSEVVRLIQAGKILDGKTLIGVLLYDSLRRQKVGVFHYLHRHPRCSHTTFASNGLSCVSMVYSCNPFSPTARLNRQWFPGCRGNPTPVARGTTWHNSRAP